MKHRFILLAFLLSFIGTVNASEVRVWKSDVFSVDSRTCHFASELAESITQDHLLDEVTPKEINLEILSTLLNLQVKDKVIWSSYAYLNKEMASVHHIIFNKANQLEWLNEGKSMRDYPILIKGAVKRVCESRIGEKGIYHYPIYATDV